MRTLFRKMPLIAILLCFTLALAACGGSGSSASSTTVSGVVMAGPTAGSTITIKTAGGTVVAGPATSAADGSFSVAIPAAVLGGDLIFEASGGTFPDEATATSGVTLGTLSAHVPAGTLLAGVNVTIDPASTIIRELVKGGKSRAAAESAFAGAFGFAPDSSVRPVFAGISTAASTAQRLAGLRVAAFSQLAKDMGIPAAKQHELILALADDLSDDLLDGTRTGGTAVTTASATVIPVDIGNRFANALLSFQMNGSLNRSKLTPDKIGTPSFVKKGLTTNYIVEYLPGSMAAAMGKSIFRIKLSNLDGTPASGRSITLRPYMYMATKSHTTPMEAVVESSTPGTYDCIVYYVMPTVMNGVPMGIWELKVTIDGAESVNFFPMVGMPMGSTSLTKLTGVIDRSDPLNPVDTDSIMGMAGKEARTWFLFNDGLTGMGGSYTFKLFLATKEMANSMLTFPAVKTGDSLLNQAGLPWSVNAILVEVSTDKTTWLPATDASNNGHWSVSGLTGLTPGTAASIYVRLTVNGLQKTTDGSIVGATNGYQTFSVTPM